MHEKQELIEFVKNFFQNLGADLIEKKDHLIISNVSEDFEKFYGKKSPYKFVFDEKNQIGEADLIEKGSYALKTISNYLENFGQTTLLKINFKKNGEEEIKKRINLPNSKIINFSKKKKFNFFFRFTFHTTYQYLNESEKIINDVYIYNGEAIKGNLSNYDVEEGSKDEIKIPDIKESYFLAKDELKKITLPKTEQVARDLNLRLEKEIQRIKGHFLQETKEIDENLEKAKKKLNEYELMKNAEKIYKQIEVIKNLKQKTNFGELEIDKERAIQLEKQKHLLNINNKLFNTTLIYYPLEIFDVTLKNEDSKRIIEICFDPLTEKLNPIFCESCEKETNDLYLCSNGHISCKDCSSTCESCNKTFCKKCLNHKCELCSKRLCKDCYTRCFRCGKIICKTHAKEDKVSKRVYCNQCLRRCERCELLKDPYSFKISKKTGAEICGDCFRKEMKEKVLKNVFD
jgi:hypothetical protein